MKFSRLFLVIAVALTTYATAAAAVPGNGRGNDHNTNTTTSTTTRTTTTSSNTTTTRATSAYFSTLPVGAALPTDATCASLVRAQPEVRANNVPYNNTVGVGGNSVYPRVSGNFTGTTDEILQWVACKWGLDENIVRAQIARESYWDQRAVGDNGESFGLGQVRAPYHSSAFVNDNAKVSSAYNVDYTYAVWRECFEGRMTWLNTVERGRDYSAGDIWGCLGVWFSGRWYTQAAIDYMGWVRSDLDNRIWETQNFLNYG
ncbi:MAG: hypothetical protein ABI658_31150 [Acidimicrobiales bacterium]